jgi:hypothetical protein
MHHGMVVPPIFPAVPGAATRPAPRRKTFGLAPGDVLSYSAGSSQTGPEGFWKLRARPGILPAALQRWPELAEPFGRGPILFINAYPASIGMISTGISVDTYLSPRVMSRALQLAAAADQPAVLCGQSLFLADALLAHVRAGRALPNTLLLLVGGYHTPRSLERMLLAMLGPRVRHLAIVHGYGVAEIDAGCMMGRERDAAGRLVFFPREDIEVELDGEELLLSLWGAGSEIVVDRWRTGDRAAPSGAGWTLWNHRRLHPSIEAALDSWTDADWERRTGYVRREGETLWIQLRQGQTPAHDRELDHWEFGRAHGFSWLDKPCWR